MPPLRRGAAEASGTVHAVQRSSAAQQRRRKNAAQRAAQRAPADGLQALVALVPAFGVVLVVVGCLEAAALLLQHVPEVAGVELLLLPVAGGLIILVLLLLLARCCLRHHVVLLLLLLLRHGELEVRHPVPRGWEGPLLLSAVLDRGLLGALCHSLQKR